MEDSKLKNRKIFSIELQGADLRNLDVVIRYFTNRKGLKCKRGLAIRMVLADKYVSILSEAESQGKSLDEFLG